VHPPPCPPPCRSTYDDQKLQLFTSSFFLAGMFISLFAAQLVRAFGRKPTMIVAALLFLAGSALNAAAPNLVMLVLGRVLLGFGVGESPLQQQAGLWC
jgi:MFS family permease